MKVESLRTLRRQGLVLELLGAALLADSNLDLHISGQPDMLMWAGAAGDCLCDEGSAVPSAISLLSLRSKHKCHATAAIQRR